MIIETADLKSFINESFGQTGEGVKTVLVSSLIGDLDEVVEGVSLLCGNTRAKGIKAPYIDVWPFRTSWDDVLVYASFSVLNNSRVMSRLTAGEDRRTRNLLRLLVLLRKRVWGVSWCSYRTEL